MNKFIKSYCRRCDFITNQSILYNNHVRSTSDEYNYENDYMVLQCNGCDTISFREDFIDIDNVFPNEDGDWCPDITTTTYPGEKKEVKVLEKTHALPDKIKSIYQEAINSFNADCPILTGVAFRAIIEAICIQENIIGKSLETKINNLVKQKLITFKEANRLHSIRFIGNDSVHEMKAPKAESLRIVLSIVEHLLNNLYLIDYESSEYLETIIKDYSEFEDLLDQCVSKLNKGDEVPLAKILGKNMRRLNGRIGEFELELIRNINAGKCTNIAIGKVDTYGNDTAKRQHFVAIN